MNTNKKIPIYIPEMGKEESEAIAEVIASKWVTQGPKVELFENLFSDFVGSNYACAVSSCTTALHLALKVIGIKEGDEVLTVSHSFIATANSVRYLGALPVFVDIDLKDFNIDPNKIEENITKKTKAILCVHQMGMPADLKSIRKLADKYKLPIIEDAACAIGSEYKFEGNWQKIGAPHSDIACFSFHPRKLLTTGDGGMLTYNDEKLGYKLKLLRQHAMSISDKERHSATTIRKEEFLELAFNYRMTDIQAAMGIVQLERLPGLLKYRRKQKKIYDNMLESLDIDVQVPKDSDYSKSNWQSYCILLPERVDQELLINKALEQSISFKQGIMCAHLEPAYNDKSWVNYSHGLKYSEYAKNHALILPLFHSLTEADQERIVSIIKAATH